MTLLSFHTISIDVIQRAVMTAAVLVSIPPACFIYLPVAAVLMGFSFFFIFLLPHLSEYRLFTLHHQAKDLKKRKVK